MQRRQVATAAMIVAAMPASAALARSTPAAVAHKCPDKEYLAHKIDHYAVNIRAANVGCATADVLFKHDLKLAGWHVSQKFVQSSPTEKVYRVRATRATAVVTLVWTVLQAG